MTETSQAYRLKVRKFGQKQADVIETSLVTTPPEVQALQRQVEALAEDRAVADADAAKLRQEVERLKAAPAGDDVLPKHVHDALANGTKYCLDNQWGCEKVTTLIRWIQSLEAASDDSPPDADAAKLRQEMCRAEAEIDRLTKDRDHFQAIYELARHTAFKLGEEVERLKLTSQSAPSGWQQRIEAAFREGYDFGQADRGWHVIDADGAWSTSGTRQNAVDALPPEPRVLTDWQRRACRVIQEAVENEDGIDGAEATKLLREVGYWPVAKDAISPVSEEVTAKRAAVAAVLQEERDA